MLRLVLLVLSLTAPFWISDHAQVGGGWDPDGSNNPPTTPKADSGGGWDPDGFESANIGGGLDPNG